MAKIDKLLEQAKAHLDPDEQVAAAIQGTYETKVLGSDSVRTGILIATQRRIVFYAKKLGGYDLESFEYKSVSSFEQSKSMMGHSISFFASGNKVNMKWISDAAAMQQFVSAVKQQMASSSGGHAPAAIPGRNVSQPVAPTNEPPADDKSAIIEAIKQLGALHEAGILTDEEFSAKKAELLGRL
ncbi:PH domain-containing protein [Terrabacter sp. MAHUQ-38]|uniref:PH domain-containing protein n=1 Tax=unclassified Terrabacter TaxID=2630222 RepID=UPI00165DAF2E|nr:PH domain-containing protein [Terrabacter sp. MAHUQ-38]MBC9822745.1 PH domain-containing protein [Terrabacter sp. MAHUQ-38]